MELTKEQIRRYEHEEKVDRMKKMKRSDELEHYRANKSNYDFVCNMFSGVTGETVYWTELTSEHFELAMQVNENIKANVEQHTDMVNDCLSEMA